MTGNIAADVEHVIATTCAADAQERLMSCVPMLEEAIENWRCGPDTAPPGSLVVAASTPLGGVVFHTSGWPEIDEAAASEFGAGDIAVAVSQAIENGNRNDIVLAGFSVLAWHLWSRQAHSRRYEDRSCCQVSADGAADRATGKHRCVDEHDDRSREHMGGSLRCGPCLRWRPPASLRWSPAAGMIWYKRAGSPPQRRVRRAAAY